MRPLVFPVLTLCLLASCEQVVMSGADPIAAQKVYLPTDTARPPGPDLVASKTPSPEKSQRPKFPVAIEIANSTISVNGRKLWLGNSLNSWKSALPGSFRCVSESNSVVICVWDELGIVIGTDDIEKTKANYLKLLLLLDKEDIGYNTPIYFPRRPFIGSLVLDGVALDRSIPFEEIRRRVDPQRQLDCGGSDCGNPAGGFSDGAAIYMQLDKRSAKGRISAFSVTCIETRACSALVPSDQRK